MGRRGPAKTPGSVRWNGNSKLIEGLPDPPVPLSGVALREWNRIGGILKDRGLLSAEDWALLLVYADTVQRYWKAWEIAEAEGLIVDKEKQSYQHPSIKIMKDCSQVLLTLSARLGLSPADRLKSPEATESDGKDKFFKTVG